VQTGRIDIHAPRYLRASREARFTQQMSVSIAYGACKVVIKRTWNTTSPTSESRYIANEYGALSRLGN